MCSRSSPRRRLRRRAAFTGKLLVELGNLVHADWVGYTETDWSRRRGLLQDDPPGSVYGPWQTLSSYYFAEIADLHPIRRATRAGRLGALRLSDFVSRRELKRTRFYTDWMLEAALAELDAPAETSHGVVLLGPAIGSSSSRRPHVDCSTSTSRARDTGCCRMRWSAGSKAEASR